MNDNSRIDSLLECLIQMIGRVAVPTDKVYKIVGSNTKYQKAFNLCEGSNNLTEVARKCGIKQGNLSVTFKRWVENGVAFWIGEGNDARPLHVYPIPRVKKSRPKRKRTR